jgi:putative two-component system response regulator
MMSAIVAPLPAAEQAIVAVVDDNPSTRHWTQAALRPLAGVEVRCYGGSAEALSACAVQAPDVALIDYRMPSMDGVELAGRLAQLQALAPVSVAIISGAPMAAVVARAAAAGISTVLDRSMGAARIRGSVRSLLQRPRQACGERDPARRALAACMARLNVLKDPGTASHMRRMALYAREIGAELGLDAAELDALEFAAPLHDLGKVGVPDAILMKRGTLDPHELRRMREHPVLGFHVLAGHGLPELDMAAQIALGHHERFDGSGYPRGLAGKAIPLAARIVAVADALDALLSVRPYKPAWSWEAAQAHIIQGSGTHFDPDVVTAMRNAAGRLHALYLAWREESVSGDAPPQPTTAQATRH